jgi:hypothetical protein
MMKSMKELPTKHRIENPPTTPPTTTTTTPESLSEKEEQDLDNPPTERVMMELSQELPPKITKTRKPRRANKIKD